MTLPMLLSVISLGIAIALAIFHHFEEDKEKKEKYRSLIVLFVLFQVGLLAVAIATNDPLFESFGVSTLWEMIAGIITAAFMAWRYYLNPMENRITGLEIVAGEIKVDIKNLKEVKADVAHLTEIRTDVRHILSELGWIRANIAVKKIK